MKKLTLPKHLPMFEAALRLSPPDEADARGMCFHKTCGFVMDVAQAKLCVGTFRAATPDELEYGLTLGYDLSKEPFIHCWPEVGGVAFLLSAANFQDRRISRVLQQQYYEQNGATNVVRMSRKRLLDLSTRYGLKNHLMYGIPLVGNLKFGSLILDELQISHTISDRGGVTPGSGDESLQLPDMLGVNHGHRDPA